MKRILIFSLAYVPHVSGAELAVKEITDRSPDIEFHLLTQRFASADVPEEMVGNVHVHRIGLGSSYFSKILFIPLAALAAARLHKMLQFNAFWALMSYMTLPIVLLRLGGVKRPYVLTLQDGDPFEHVFSRPHIKPFEPLLRMGFKEASVVQVISKYLKEWPAHMGYTGAVEVIPNGVDVAQFANVSPEAVAEKKEQLNKREGDVLLVTTSRLVEKNAIDVVIRALVHLPQHVRFVVLGSGSEEKELARLTSNLGLAARVHFFGNISHAELPAYLHACDIFVRPSRTEGMGSSFIEAFAAGLPVIATQEGGIADFLFDPVRNSDHAPTGFAVDKDNPQQIAEKVQEILENPEQTKRVIENAKALAAKKYDWDLLAKDMQERVFSRVVKAE